MQRFHWKKRQIHHELSDWQIDVAFKKISYKIEKADTKKKNNNKSKYYLKCDRRYADLNVLMHVLLFYEFQAQFERSADHLALVVRANDLRHSPSKRDKKRH